MAEQNSQEKSETAKREEEVLKFWKENTIFEKSLKKRAPKGEFVFYDGPPFATGLPHTGSLLSSIIKDVVPRYKTMRGYVVQRRWGWDCHGLPIESLIEKRLNLKTKKDILDIGIDTFNEAARASVMEFEHEWEKYVDRVGRWVDFKNSYKTMDNSYIESVWWALKQLYEKSLLYEGNKVLMYCPHCETPLAKAEIAMDHTYKDITEEAVTVRFKIKRPSRYGLPENTHFLAWTTTPWTLPGNVGLAVGPGISYVLVPESGGMAIVAKDRLDILKKSARPRVSVDMGREYKGSELVGMEYEPLYDVVSVIRHGGNKHVVLPADFVSTEEGTGVVHTAVMYGEDDFALGQKENLPKVQLLNPNGTYNKEAPAFLQGKYIKEAERDIKRDLESRGLLFERENHTHSYPHCYRCGTPLIYNAVASWFINIQKVKDKMLSENEKVQWVPEHLKHGRFKNIVENAPDWTISRNRFWASPLPIWKEKKGNRVMVVGSLDEIKKKSKKSGNKYFVMRHAWSTGNENGTLSSDKDADIGLTEKGIADARASLRAFGTKVDIIYTSSFKRTRETADIAAEVLGVPKEHIKSDDRLGECNFGPYSGKTLEEYHAAFPEKAERFSKGPEGGETYVEIRRRMMSVLSELEKSEKGKNILIISHGTPLWLLCASARGLSREEALSTRETDYPKQSVITELSFVPLPYNADYELDLHRPYTDSLTLLDEEGREYERIPEVVDCWVESGSMPFAEQHYPFENKSVFEKRAPGDFIAEYIAQTRTWFYYMHAMGVLLFGRLAFRNVVSTGTILAADSSKMSKSKGNYTDPLVVMDRYGADALRFYLMGSVVMQAEDLNFRDEDVRDTHNRVMGLLWNTYKFYELYKKEYEGKAFAKRSTNLLDQWVIARLNETVRTVTNALDAFNMPPAARAIRDFVEDYSTWYVRRSRERVKGSDKADKQFALATQREVLLDVAKMLAPIAPFIAESVYRGVGGALESVHLEEWPSGISRGFFSRLFGRDKSKESLANMAAVRAAVSRALEARERARMKIRQPLSALILNGERFPIKESGLLDIIKEEVNVKRVDVGDITDDVWLDTALTPELKREGLIREVSRTGQAERKLLKLSPEDRLFRVIVRGTNDTILAVKEHESYLRESLKTDVLMTEVDESGKEPMRVSIEKR
ncbi:MAG: isoleucyl-tRNA synthetase [Parcubacteria group bacterium Gr01-1014_8]|nr:MAG: isoleucyl-tRNA synthetase [Parcubacteria group bacterium Gr01-1014_8]